jgi:hypothetical protein
MLMLTLTWALAGVAIIDANPSIANKMNRFIGLKINICVYGV